MSIDCAGCFDDEEELLFLLLGGKEDAEGGAVAAVAAVAAGWTNVDVGDDDNDLPLDAGCIVAEGCDCVAGVGVGVCCTDVADNEREY